MSGTATPPAGWYNDPSQAGTQRYWDGAAWTLNTRPLPGAAVVPAADVAVEEVESAVEEAPPPWAAEVVAAEAASYNSRPWWNQPKFVAPLLLLVGLVALVSLIGLTGGDETEVSADGGDDQARAIAGPDDTETPTSVAADEAIATDDQADAPSTTTTSADPPTASVASPAGATETVPSDDIEGDTADTSPEPEVASETESTTTATESASSTTASTEAVASVEGVSASCLDAMQDAAEVPDEVDVPEDLYPTFASCTTFQEWKSAASSTDIANRVNIDSWVPTGCVLNTEFYELPLCTSAIDPNSGPRRIDCGDGREEMEWVFADDDRSNDQVCADHFQIRCDDGTIHNIPNEALSEDEALATICI